ncbi:MAG: hypothetical protein M1828_003897 [Chrysothrix sp. TS-e1954]|nr:MAG: hypothetical protein M1828_003897 [Chrysothrix sp. TS-e1954]
MSDSNDGKSNEPAGGYDATPIPHAPPGYTVKITFHRATHLPLADFSTLSSDPFMEIELKTALQQRHKEDPNLRFRTQTIWRNTEPEFEREWIIANVPASGFKLKARIYDEDSSDQDDRLGNVHLTVGRLDGDFKGIHDQPYKIKRRSGSWRAYALRAIAVCMKKAKEMSGEVYFSVEVLGKTPGDEGGRAYTIGKNYWCKHYSPLLGRIAGSKVPADVKDAEKQDQSPPKSPQSQSKANAPPAAATNEKAGTSGSHLQPPKSPKPQSPDRPTSSASHKKRTQKYNFQANQFQLRGPVPPSLYHRYVEFRPFVRSMFTATGFRGFLLSKALHHQHMQVYNFNRDTEYGCFDSPCDDMTLKFLELCHFDHGGKIHTYVITLDGLMRFTETGKEFGIDLLSKHTMHADRSPYIAFSGEFFIRRLKHRHRPPPEGVDAAGQDMSEQEKQQTEGQASHPPNLFPTGPPNADPPLEPSRYELIIDNDSGTYRPNAHLLPDLRHFLEGNFPGVKVVTLDCQKDEELMKKLKTEQRDRKKAEGRDQIVFTQVSRSSSVSSSDEERLNDRANDEDHEYKQKYRFGEAVAPLVGNHERVRGMLGEERIASPAPGHGGDAGGQSHS